MRGLKKDNYKDVLNAIGFGEELCKKTNERDGRYGRLADNGIEYGFEDSMHSSIRFGKYVVIDNGYSSHSSYTKEEFNEDYIICE